MNNNGIKADQLDGLSDQDKNYIANQSDATLFDFTGNASGTIKMLSDNINNGTARVVNATIMTDNELPGYETYTIIVKK
ncbi:hypothetical protein EC840_104249 [Rahnella sp. JUb53]|uniref:hypothetical protein n=1 Tax=Rahnella sp. JUb53 TaxID=2485128 RepID=UPI00104F7F69|nr:hypothetical protein [Rahnella sp. JUb53]TCQ89343.1 hypothetical protein EC840_104249 [Rahnella sp. JUb53]